MALPFAYEALARLPVPLVCMRLLILVAAILDFEEADQETFIACRPDGLAFDKEKKSCVFLEYTRAMDTNEDWATKKEQEKDDTYSTHLQLSRREKSGWKATQINFTTGVRRSLHTNQLLTRLETLGVNAQIMPMVPQEREQDLLSQRARLPHDVKDVY